MALYFTSSVFRLKIIPFKWLLSKGTLTAITAFILIVGLVYQVALRGIWQPTGLQHIVDELLHTIIPLYVFMYWFFKVNKNDLPFFQKCHKQYRMRLRNHPSSALSLP